MSSPEDVSQLPDPERRRLFGALVRDYAQRGTEAGPPFEESEVTATEVAVTVAAMMRAVEVTSFEVAALFNV